MATKTEQTRQLIISKSLPIFNTKGYTSTSISDITNATGITKGSIYGNFKNKDEVASAAFEYGVSLITQQITSVIKAESSAPKKLLALINYYSTYVDSPPIEGGCPVLNSSIEADDTLPYLREQVVRSITQIKGVLIKIINRGIEEEQIKKRVNAEEFATSFYAMLEGAISLSRIEGDKKSFLHIMTFMEKTIEDISI